MRREKMGAGEIQGRMAQMTGWSVEDEKLTKTFSFDSYAGGVMFAAALGHLADRMDHHPDLAIGYEKVRFSVNTHDVGGISEWDFELARRADELFG